MYAVVKTGGKQYKVEPGTVLSVEKLNAEVGEEVELPVIFVADGDSIEADPAKAASTKVIAEVLDQYKGKKQIVFKFKKRKGYKKLKGHRQQLTKVRVVAVGAEKLDKAAVVSKAEELKEEVEEKVESTIEAIEEKAEELAEAIEAKAEEAAEAVEEKAEEVVEAAEEAIEEASEEILEETAGEAVEEAISEE